jgi:formyltetrahydrofolate synthetase
MVAVCYHIGWRRLKGRRGEVVVDGDAMRSEVRVRDVWCAWAMQVRARDVAEAEDLVV